jgi:hypothetical protein
MLSHQIGAANRADLKRLSALEQRCADLETELSAIKARAARQLHERDTALQKINARLIKAMDAERQLQFASHRIRNFERGKELQRLRARVRDLVNCHESSLRVAARATQQRDDLERQLNESNNTTQKLRNALGDHTRELQLLRPEQQPDNDAISCYSQDTALPDVNLCGRCVLFVGGRAHQCSHYRRLVEHHNGRFIHHDGGREDGRQRLGTILPQADVVLCPLYCVSHDAVNRIKRFCSKHTKQLVFMPRASLSAFARCLTQVVA